MGVNRMYFVDMTVGFVVFDHAGMESVLEYVNEVIGKFREVKDHQPLMVNKIKVETIKKEILS